MEHDSRRVAGMAADHVTTGFLQGTGFAIASIIVGIAATIVVRHPIGLLLSIGGIVWLFVRWRKRRRPTIIDVSTLR